MRKGKILYKGIPAGELTEDDEGYTFAYYDSYLQSSDPQPISATMPLQSQPYPSTMLHPFFDGLIPEGWLLDVSARNWKLKTYDRMGLLLACCRDCIGAVSVEPITDEM